MNPFQKIINLGQNIFQGSKAESVIGIDIGSSSIKVVQLKKKGGKAVLETYGSLSLGPYAKSKVGDIVNLDNDSLSLALKDVMREAGVTTNSAGVGISAGASLIFLIDLPLQVEDKEYASIVPTEARKYIPVPISEVSLDFWPIPRRDTSLEDSSPDVLSGTPKVEVEKKEILITAIHNDTVSKYREIVKKSEIEASFFEVEVFSSIRATFGRELSPILLIDFGASRTKLAIIEYGIVRVFHIVNRGSKDITNALSKSLGVPFERAEEMKREQGLTPNVVDSTVHDIIKLSTDYIFSETSNTILTYEKKYNKNINKVILSGGGSLLKGFKELAEDAFRAEVVMADPFGKVEAPAFLSDILQSTGPEFAVSVGLALRKLQSE